MHAIALDDGIGQQLLAHLPCLRLGGDGIGPDVIAEGLKVIGAAGVELETVDYDLGGARYGRDGTVLPDEVIEENEAAADAAPGLHIPVFSSPCVFFPAPWSAPWMAARGACILSSPPS